MSIYEKFCTSAEEHSKAAELAKEWKKASPATRKAACKKMGGDFEMKALGSISVFTFHANGTVTTKNIRQPVNRWDEPYWAKTAKKYEIDESRKVVGFAWGRPIYAK